MSEKTRYIVAIVADCKRYHHHAFANSAQCTGDVSDVITGQLKTSIECIDNASVSVMNTRERYPDMMKASYIVVMALQGYISRMVHDDSSRIYQDAAIGIYGDTRLTPIHQILEYQMPRGEATNIMQIIDPLTKILPSIIDMIDPITKLTPLGSVVAMKSTCPNYKDRYEIARVLMSRGSDPFAVPTVFDDACDKYVSLFEHVPITMAASIADIRMVKLMIENVKFTNRDIFDKIRSFGNKEILDLLDAA